MTPQRVDSQRRMANVEARGLQAWSHLGLSVGDSPTLRQGRAMHTLLDSRQALVHRYSQSAPPDIAVYANLYHLFPK
jgi:hypothetical protein